MLQAQGGLAVAEGAQAAAMSAGGAALARTPQAQIHRAHIADGDAAASPKLPSWASRNLAPGGSTVRAAHIS